MKFYIINTEETIRDIAKVFGVSKSTVHKDLSERLLEVDSDLYNYVDEILQYHIKLDILEEENQLDKIFKSKSKLIYF